MKVETTTQSIALRLLGIGLAATIIAPLQAQEDMEWEPGEGYHEEEWYDPSDWFNDDGQTDYEYDYDGYDYYDGSWDGYTWYDDYDYAYDFDTESEYVWNQETDSWEMQSEDDGYDFAAKYEFDDNASSQNRNSEAGSSQKKQSQSMQGSQNQSQQTINGTIDAFRKIDVSSTAGYQETHALARISLDNGQSAVVDLGMASLLTSDLSSGDKVTFHGSSGKIDGKNVFVASRLTAGDETVYIDRTLPAKGSGSSSDRNKSSNKQSRSDDQMSSSSSRSGSGDMRQMETNQKEQLILEGKIAEKEVVQLEGENESQTVVKIELQNGKSASVKLGSETSLKDLDLEKGDRISVRGHREQISGKNIVVAQSIRVEGKKVKG